MALSNAMLGELTARYETPQELKCLYSQVLKHMVNRALDAEMQQQSTGGPQMTMG